MKVFNHTKYQYKQNPPTCCHVELGWQRERQSYSDGSDRALTRRSRSAASDQSTKLHPSFGMSGKSSQSFPACKTLKQVQGDSFCYHPNINYRISFGALKKRQFDGIDLAVVEKFKAPIEKFNSNNDLQIWAKKQAESIANTDFGGRQKETVIQRNTMFREWSDYVLNENDAYNNATSLLILNAITKDIKQDNDKLPPVLNKGVLADCISEIDKNTKANKKYQFDLNKMYETKLRALYLEDTKVESGNTGWVVIPSKSNDPENFEQNVEKLKTLSHKNWCTKSFNAEPYLSQGDFHVYLEDGQPKLGVRFVDDKIQEIQGELNNSRIPLRYFDEAKRHIAENGFYLSNNASKEILLAQKAKREIEKAKRDLRESIENKDIKAIFKYFAIPVKEDDNGFLTISEYKQPSEEFSFSDIGIDENMFFEKVKKIEGNSTFSYSKVTDLKNLKSIGGFANFENSKITDLGNLESIGDFADFCDSQVTNLGNLISIGGSAYFNDSKVINLGNLTSIGWNAIFENSQITKLENLTSIGGDAYFENSKVKTLGKLTTIGKNANFKNSQVADLGNLKSIGGFAHFRNSHVTNLGNLESIGKHANFQDSQITDLGKLKSIGGNVCFADTEITDLGNLESIGGFAYFTNSKITGLGKLESIGEKAVWGPKIEDFGNLKTVNGEPFVPFK